MRWLKVTPPPGGGRSGFNLGPGPALLIWACSLLLMGLLSLGFTAFPTHASMPVFVAAVALIAVLLPALAGFGWMIKRGEGSFPNYGMPSPLLLLAIVFMSLPLYALSATILTAIGDERSSAGFPSPDTAWWSWIGLWVAYALLPAITEELLYRGLLQPAISIRWGIAWGIGLTSALFALTHMEVAGVIPRMLMGVWFGFLAWRTGSLWGSTWAHTWNNTWGVMYLTFAATIAAHPWLTLFGCIASLGASLGILRHLSWLQDDSDGANTTQNPEGSSGTIRLVRIVAESTVSPSDGGPVGPPVVPDETQAE
ncbi:MAG: CPBP family intramembrane glutamic endopeptidase [Candidatus Sericytochromatia bacterium]|nr:CPBP family intramembrane glutamic endopeptidase [Candidatus Sericytochromatia bacterium]